MAVFWKPKEIRDLAEYCVGIGLFPETWGFVKTLGDVQVHVLPESRRRTVRKVKQVQNVIDEIRKLRGQRAQEDTALKERVAEAVLEPEAPAPVEPTAQTRLADNSFDALIDALVTKLSERLIGGLREQLAGIIREQLPPELKPREVPGGVSYIPRFKPSERDIKPRVVVVGLLSQQAEDVEHAFKGQIEFTFVKSQQAGSGRDGGHGMLNRSKKADVVIAVTKFIGHDVETAAKKLECPYVRLNGSVSSLKKWLVEYLDGEHRENKPLPH